MTSTDRKLPRWVWAGPAILSVALVCLVLVSIGQGWLSFRTTPAAASSGNDHDHEDEPAVTYTSWMDGVEIFVEHPLVVAEEPFEMMVHVTLTDNGEPLSAGNFKLRLNGPGGLYEMQAKGPGEPGAWVLPVCLSRAGRYRGELELVSTSIPGDACGMEIPSLAVYESEDAAHAAAEAKQETGVAAVEFLKEQQWRISLRSEVLRPRDIAESLIVPGKVKAPDSSEAMIVPPVPGRVMPPTEGRFPQVGERVAAGQVLAVIEPSVAGAQSVQLLVNQAELRTLDAELAAKQLDIEAKVASAEADLELANKEVERLEGLSEGGVVAEKRLVEARYRQKQALASLQGSEHLRETYARAHQRLTAFLEQVQTDQGQQAGADSLEVALRSPLEGSVVVSEVTEGEFVGNDHLLFRIVDMRKLLIDAEVSEYGVADVEQSSGARFRLSAYPDRIFPIFGPGDGRLVFIGAVVDPESRTVCVRYEVPNDEGLLRLGMFADVMIQTACHRGVVVLPERAIVDDSGEAVVYVQTGGQTFERRPVQLGLQDGKEVEIRRGLAFGERVVTEGAYVIRLSTLAGGVPEHHHHH